MMAGRSVWILFLVVVTSMGISCTMPVDSDEFRERVLDPRTFAVDVDRCREATRMALVDRGYEIKREGPGGMVTERRTFTVNARSEPLVSSAENRTQHFQMEQSDQLWIEIEGGEQSCVVGVSRMRLWNGAEETLEIQSMGASWARTHIVEALYREIEFNL